MFTKPWKAPQRIALFGTSADQPHLGHQSILLWLAQSFDQVVVWAADNPYKDNQSPIHNRAEMLRLLVDTLPSEGPDPFRKSLLRNSSLGKVSVNQNLSDRFSIHSIAKARALWPRADFSFVVGADLLAQLPQWYQAKEMFAQVDILVFPRPGYPVQGPALSRLRQLATVHIAHPPDQYDVSSSAVRQTRCAESVASLADTDLPSIIRDYITEHNLYPCQQQTPKAKVSTH
ncbi:MAG: nicotinate-nucleotide adenylyltransferase [Phormidesmis sp.]